MGAVIAPAITVENANLFKESMERINGFAERVHIDISDGEFAPVLLMNASEAWWPANWQADIHAMVARPSEHLEQLIALKPNLIIFHVEAQEDLQPILQRVKAAGIKAGVALLRPTVPSTVPE